MNWMLLPYRRYFQFAGRSRRKEYWMFTLFGLLVNLALTIVFGRTTYTTMGWYTGGSTQLNGVGDALSGLFALFNFIPSLAVSVRRLHDIDRSGWWFLLIFLPILGWFALLVFMCLDGTRGSNRYGSDPKNPYEADVFQ
ncbi:MULTISPECIES: DUF805 domain-containing protein [unclassified Novosphingobium]|uniref:DUF805 domain-containing protein n=1 Tax=unclassified Novosphingobium TaxID=2644732 RepID=UPI0014941E03|nr:MULTISPECIES: DUF805 domain-containing protein [unclassified Novosphingobium]MBB3356663.1 uncharacterized membrane protein YhaH (DUF805 family) [Novosphingobium sp. BK256]MBB3373064.1 uncharacterized membrane protein YhaH (DUF805 family) [Novosphingobium sp. BK280]MBB3377432.1 uncharacterized membrane protein YhaH (DUF805 family) [Novosphingobium sp. BK258]MBB3419157.1 uncharacterized membrane protein YhaH (DUF805 family) [Novosphingobium sp. BK267]MBB3449026.1 uncharacterized membrane prot